METPLSGNKTIHFGERRSSMIQNVGFVGLGVMGKPMSSQLLKAGFSLTVFDINQDAVEELVKQGARNASSAKEVAEASEAIITMLPADEEVKEVLLGKEGVMEGIRKGTIVVDMSTISPQTAKALARELEEKGMEMLDAPVSGGQEGAREATLTIMVGGKEEIFEQMKPAFQTLGKNISYVGGHGAGQVAKACNQIIVALTIEAVAEALIFAKKTGFDPERVRKALLGGYAHSRVLEVHGRRMTDRNFVPGGKVRSHKKDIEIVMAVARELGICLPGTALASHLWNAVVAQGGIDWDHSSMVKVLESMSGTEL
jgi:2-hydroxy-3-oxopropionate reductase